MKQGFKSVFAMAAVLVFAAAAYAGMTMVNGEVTKYEAGKTIAVKDAKGATETFEISKDTKVEGEVKAGAKVAVEADGKKAHSVKVSK